MEVSIRPAHPGDKEGVAAFASHTFEWGDYVLDAFDGWLEDPGGLLLVATGPGEEPVAMARGALLSPTEAWAQGARVHPDHRRRGIGKQLNDALCDWAAERGAQVMRLLVEDWNHPATAQVHQLGYRPAGRWVLADRSVPAAAPEPAANGDRRTRPEERLSRAPSAEAEPAFLAWAGSDLARRSRELFPVGWTWRRLTIGDLTDAARRGALWTARAGWAIGQGHDDAFRASWVATGPEDAHAMLRALADRAAGTGASTLEVMAPEVPWLTRALRRRGMELRPMTVYAKAIGEAGRASDR